MKKIILTIFLMIFIAIFSSGVLALDLGSDRQEASNPAENDIFTASSILTLNSTYTEASCTIALSNYAINKGISNDYNNNTRYDLNLTFNGFKAGELFSSATETAIIVKAVIPATLDAVSGRGIAGKFIIGTINCNGETEDLYMQRENKLSFDDVYLTYGDDSEKLSDGENVDDLKPGDGVSIEADIENTYSNSEDVEIDDVDFFVEADNDLDVDEEESIGRISEDDKDTEKVSFDIDSDADEGNYDLFIWTLGSDYYNAKHGDQIKVDVEIDKEKDDVSLKRVSLNPSSVSLCNRPYATVIVSIENIGKNDQDEVMLTLRNTLLNYYQKLTQIELEEDDLKTKRFTIEVPTSAKAGTYRFEVEVYNDDNEITDTQEVTLLVKKCFDAQSQETTQTSNYNNIGTTQVIGSNQPQAGALAAAQLSGGNVDLENSSDKTGVELSTIMIVALILLVILLIILAIVMLIK